MTDYELVLRGEVGDRFGCVRRHAAGARRGHTVSRRRARPGPAPRVIERIQELGLELISVNPTGEDDARHDRPDPRLLGHPRAAGSTGWPATSRTATRSSRPPTRASRSRSRRSTPTPRRSRRVTVPQIIEHLEAVVGGVDAPPILIGHSAGGVFTQILLDHGFGASGVAINSAPDRGRQARPAVAGPGHLPGAQEPRQPPPRRRLHARAVALRVHQHVQRGGVPARSTSATTSPPRARSSGAARSPTSTRARTTTGSTTTTTTARRCCSSPAAKITSCRRASSSPTPSTTSRTTVTEVEGVRGPAPAARLRRAGRRSPTTRSTGRERHAGQPSQV